MMQKMVGNDQLTDLLRILIADDHLLVSEAVSSVLRAEGRFEVKLTKDLNGALKHLAEGVFDVVLLDFRMPGMVGLDSINQVVKAANSSRVVLFTGQIEKHVVDRALEIGVRGLIPKTLPLKSLGSVIDLINSGQVFVPVGSDAPQAVSESGSVDLLSQKEHTVLRFAAEGMTNKEIARDMGTSEVTVKMHMRAICKKLGARNRAHAAILSRELALL